MRDATIAKARLITALGPHRLMISSRYWSAEGSWSIVARVNRQASASLQVDPQQWLNASTTNMELLRSVESRLLDGVIGQSGELSSSAQRDALRNALLIALIGGWFVARRLARLSVDCRLLVPFVVACWARYVAQLLPRLIGSVPGAGATADGPAALSDEAVALVRQDRDLALWRCAVRHVDAMSAAAGALA